MEDFSFRSLLSLTMYVAIAGGLLGLVTSLGWFFRPSLSRKSVLAAQTSTGITVPMEVSDKVTRNPLLGASWFVVVICFVAFVINLGAMFARYYEVRHWPAQTMYEVIPLGTTMGFLSSLVLYYVLGLQKTRGIARGFSDMFMALILFGGAGTLYYVLGLDPTGRALPPALQSYWFPTHITAYMFGYFTMFIATLAVWLHFSFKFWRGVLQRKEYPVAMNQLIAIAAFTFVPGIFGKYGLYMGPGVFFLAGIVGLISQALPNKMAWFDQWEKGSDNFTWKIFIVGFPFLTAGLIQGALWAQEAWAIYWGWDSKEVSALISWLFYAVYLHLRYVAGWRGEKGMWILLFGGISVYITFQLFGDLPASQSSLHRYTDMDTVPAEGLMGRGPGS